MSRTFRYKVTSDRSEYVRHLAYTQPGHVDPAVLRGLINCLTPPEACHAISLALDQPYDYRRLLIQQIAIHAEVRLLDCHIDLVANLLDQYESLPYSKKLSCASMLDNLYDFLRENQQREILELFFSSHYKAIRRRAYQRLIRCPESPLRDSVWNAWEQCPNAETARLVINLASGEQIASRFNELETVVKGTWLENRLYVRMAETNREQLEYLQHKDGIAYAYACVKTGEPLTNDVAVRLYKQYAHDERIGLLIWCIGKLQLWDALVAIVQDPKHQPYATITIY